MNGGDRPIVFVSDVHLYHGGDAYLGQFLQFLERVGKQAARVYIHGDLFDFYVGPRQGKQPFYRPLFAKLREVVESGVPVFLVHGNRDFLMGKRFREVGVELLPDEVDLDLGGQRVHLSHGDQFCIHDRSYQFWARGVLRAGPVRFVVRNLPVRFAFWLAARYRKVSARKLARHRNPENSRLHTIMDGVRELLSRERYDFLICGHIHHLAETPLEVAGRSTRLFTTGAWEEHPNYIEFVDGRLALRRFDPEPVPVP